MRLGVFGGSFDPVHRGHVAAAETLRVARDLERVLLIPAASPPHKPGGCVAPFGHRVAMARLAVAGRPGLEVLDLEGRRPGPSYMVDTIAVLRRRYPDVGLELLVGADMLEDFPLWHRADELEAALAAVVAFGRPGTDAERARAAFAGRFGTARLAWVELPPVAASSTEVRRCLARGEGMAELLDGTVSAYNCRHGLYGVSGGG